MNTTRMIRRASATLSVAIAAALAACASAPVRNASLDDARAAYQQASTDPTVSRVATKELQAAQSALATANGAFANGQPKEEVDHLAYLAKQRTAVAVQAGRIADSDKSIADTQTQRANIVLESRTREVEARTLEAEARTREAENQRRLSDQRLAAAQAAQAQANASRTRAASLESQLAELKAKETDRGMVLTLGDVLFDTGKATLTAGAARTADQLATFLANNPTRRVLIEGYTDSTGSDATNLELSQRRADAVRAALSQRGIGADRVDTRGLGAAYAVASNDNAAGRQLNRRVEVVFSDADGGFKMRRN